MRQRLRQEAAVDYQVVRDNFVWPDHILRLLVTAGAVAWVAPDLVADPACGDASILEAAYRLRPFRRAYLSDISEPMIAALQPSFPAEKKASDALSALAALPPVDVVVLTEILEHIDDPDALVRAARATSSHLVASSPLNENAAVGNHEHLWSWDKDGYRQMLVDAGWRPMAYTEISFPMPGFPYTFQLWVCQ